MKSLKYIIAIAALLTLYVSCSKENEYDIFSTITGKVVDAQTNQPIEGVNVYLTPTSNNCMTGADGSFTFTELEERQYTITAQKNGYSTNRVSVTTISGGTVDKTITLTKAE